MNQTKLFEESNFRKLEFFFRTTEKGFVLLTVNEYYIVQKINEFLSKNISAQFYNTMEMNFNDILNNFQFSNDISSVVFYNFFMSIEDTSKLLDKFNLARDLMLNRVKYCVFIVPVYIESYIHENLPNLYSYFQIKERFLRLHKNYFEYILPEDMYLKTKLMQRNLKREIYDMKDDIFRRLDGFLHIRISDETFDKLKSDIESSKLKYDNKLYYKMQLSLAKLAAVQERFDDAIEIYSALSRDKTVMDNINQFIEVQSGLADSLLYMEEFNRAYKIYSKLLSVIVTDLYDMLEINVVEEYQVRIYSKIALCQIKCGEVDNVKKIIKQTMNHIKEIDDKNKFFHVYYNYFIMYLEIYPERTIESDRMLNALEDFPKNEVQDAMYLTVKSWYEGIIEGKLYRAIQNSYRALKIKRDIYIENDARIAESHYLNALLLMFTGKFKEAHNCCEKSCNILKNINIRENQKKKSRELLLEINKCMNN